MTYDSQLLCQHGRFAFDCVPYIWSAQNPTGFLPESTPARLTITARGMAFLAACGQVPDVPKGDIDDRSKADALAKTLVVIQAAWMLMQVIGRLIEHLPVTLLEVNTVAHVLCALLMYAMWWNKPLTPKEPILADVGDWVAKVLAFMYMSSEVSGTINKKQIKSQTVAKNIIRISSRLLEDARDGVHMPAFDCGHGSPQITDCAERTKRALSKQKACHMPKSFTRMRDGAGSPKA